MRKQYSYLAGLAFMAIMAISCDTETAIEETVAVAMEPDMGAIKAQIQEIETAYAVAQSSGDVDAIMAIYADDAISMGNDQPVISGGEALRKDIAEGIAERIENSVTTFTVTEVFGSENQVTEMGTSTVKDADGTVISTGKYMAIWEKRDGKYLCIRDIYNSDAAEE